MSQLGAVVIGRNEGTKLRRCLASVVGKAAPVVYVDSGSLDGSVGLARAARVEVVELDPAIPFTVARARNEGFVRLVQVDPSVELVQFIDADSEMVDTWFALALQAFAADSRCAAVCGRLIERSSGRSIYGRLYSIMNDARLADPAVSNGIAMMRVAPFREMDGFVPWLVGSEDREISLRLGRAGWRVRRIDADMAVHEAGMETFGQWWRRRMMNGRSSGQQMALGAPDRRIVREWLSICFWGLALPVLALASAAKTGGASLLLFLGYAKLALRIHGRMRRLGFAPPEARLYAAACTVEKFPKALGLVRYYLESILRRLGVHRKARDSRSPEGARLVAVSRLDPDRRS